MMNRKEHKTKIKNKEYSDTYIYIYPQRIGIMDIWGRDRCP
jgi:hypothetical protein